MQVRSCEKLLNPSKSSKKHRLKKENTRFQLANQERFLQMILTCVNKGSEKWALCYAARGPVN